MEAGVPEVFEAALTAIVQGQADALRLADDALVAAYRPQLPALALRHRLPTMADGRHDAEAGNLLAYGA